MWYIIGILILSFLTLICSLYLLYKVKISRIIFIIVIFNLLYYGSIEIIGIIGNIKNEIDFNNKIQLYSKDHPDYGLLKQYDSLTDEEKRIYDYYIGDGGRNIFLFIINPFIFVVNAVLLIIICYLIYIIRKKHLKY